MTAAPAGRLSRQLHRQFWTQLVPFVVMSALAGWLTLQAGEAIERGKNQLSSPTSATSTPTGPERPS